MGKGYKVDLPFDNHVFDPEGYFSYKQYQVTHVHGFRMRLKSELCFRNPFQALACRPVFIVQFLQEVLRKGVAHRFLSKLRIRAGFSNPISAAEPIGTNRINFN